MMDALKELYQVSLEKIYNLSVRERILLTCVVVAVIYSVWTSLVYDTLSASKKNLSKDRQTYIRDINGLMEEKKIVLCLSNDLCCR